MGKMLILAATTKSSGSSAYLLLGFVVLIGLLYFVMIRPQRRRQQQAMQTQREIVPGVRVRTTAGMYATVKSVEDQDVVLEIVDDRDSGPAAAADATISALRDRVEALGGTLTMQPDPSAGTHVTVRLPLSR